MAIERAATAGSTMASTVVAPRTRTKRQQTNMAVPCVGRPPQIVKPEPVNNRGGNRLAPWTAVEGNNRTQVIAQQVAQATRGRAEQVGGEIA